MELTTSQVALSILPFGYLMRTLSLIFLATLTTTCWAQKLNPQRAYLTFALGASGIYASIEKQMQVTVKQLAAETPASGSGLLPGDVLISAGGTNLGVHDPRVPPGKAIGAAEATTGKRLLGVRRGTKQLEIEVPVKVLGLYSDKWPADCKKSDLITKQTAQYVASCQAKDGTFRSFANSLSTRNGTSETQHSGRSSALMPISAAKNSRC